MKVLFIHGWATNSKVWSYQSPVFEQFDAAVLDLPGHSNVDRWYEPSFRPGVEKIRNSIGDDDTVAIGWSLGGDLLLSLAIRRCEGLKGMVLVASSPSYIKRPNFPYGQSRALVRRMRKDLKADFRGAMERFYTLNFSGADKSDKRFEDFLGVLRTTTEGIVKEDMITSLDALTEEEMVDEVSSIDIPTLIVHGSSDPVCPVDTSKYLAERLQKAELKIMEGAGHAPFLTEAKEFNKIVTSFLGNIENA